MTLDVLGVVVSLVILAAGGDQFIVAVSRLAAALDMRPTIVGALVGGLGTSIVELIVAALASARGSADLAVGSLVGSIAANVCLALAVAALIAPVRVDSATLRREAPISVLAVGLFALLTVGGITRADGVLLLLAIVPALAALVLGGRRARIGEGEEEEEEVGREFTEFVERQARSTRFEMGRGLVSLVLMLGGAELMVRSTISLSDRLGWAQSFAGVTLVGIGTSTPLIASSIQGARRGEHDLVVGNVLGGNLFIALAGGAVAGLLLRGTPGRVGGGAIALMLAVVVASWVAMARGRVLLRWEAALLLVAYGAALPFANR
jgi:cation:H+ antiporter